MKATTIFMLAIVAVVTASVDVNSRHQTASNIVQECSERAGITNLVQKLHNEENINMDKAGEMALCMNTKLGVMTQNGDILVDKLRAGVEKNDKYKNKVDIIVYDCGKRNGVTAKESAVNFVKCMSKYMRT